jgi:hypothetical protein
MGQIGQTGPSPYGPGPNDNGGGKSHITVAGIGALTAIAVAFIGAYFAHSGGGNDPSPSASPSQPSVSPTGSPVESTKPPSATLKTPANGTKVSRRKGFVATGTASSLGSYTVWILDYDGGYTVDQEAKINGEQWSAADYPLGSRSDRLPFPLTMKAVLANADCATKLNKVSRSNSDYITYLPSGCKIIGQTTVNVSRP